MAANKLRPHHPAEFAKLLEWASGAESILEIGSRYGYALCDLAAVAKPGARIVAVDLPGAGDWGEPDSMPTLYANAALMRTRGHEVHVLIGDSTDTNIIKWVQDLGPYDFVFIDGDHRYLGAWSDWLNYGVLGKRVAFHDIRQPTHGENQNLEVWRVWKDLKEGGANTEEFIAPDSKMGVGLVSPHLS